MNKVIIGPFLGEFGIMVVDHLRWVESIEANEKIVCCEAGTECLYPSATGFFTDYTNPIPDSNRCNRAFYRGNPTYIEQVQTIYDRIWAAYPEHELMEPNYLPREEMMQVKVPIVAPAELPVVDISVCPRYRQFATERTGPSA